MELKLEKEPTLEERIAHIHELAKELGDLLVKIIWEADQVGYIKGMMEQAYQKEMKGE